MVIGKFPFVNVDQKSIELLKKLDAYVQQNFDDLLDKFLLCFEQYCRQIAQMQETGKKGEIGFIHLSILKTNILAKRHQIRLDAYDKNWYLDRVECSGTYDVGAFYQGLDEFADALEKSRNSSVNRVKLSDVQHCVFEESNKYLLFVAELVRVALRNVSDLAWFQAMKRDEVFMICIGGYQDKVDILYKEDSSEKDAKVVKRHLQAKHQPAYSHEICRSLDLSGGDYAGIHLLFSNFAECDFSGSQLQNSTILFGNFQQAVMKDVNLENTEIFDTDFSGALLENVSFHGAKLRQLSFAQAKLINVQFEGALYVQDLDFDGAELVNTLLPEVKMGR